MSDELVEYLAEQMHKEWLEVMVEQGWHDPVDCPTPGIHRCSMCREGMVPWADLSEEVKEVNRRGARRFLKEVGLSERAERGAVGKAVALNRSIISLAERPHNADDEYLKGQRVLARKTLYALGEEV